MDRQVSVTDVAEELKRAYSDFEVARMAGDEDAMEDARQRALAIEAAIEADPVTKKARAGQRRADVARETPALQKFGTAFAGAGLDALNAVAQLVPYYFTQPAANIAEQLGAPGLAENLDRPAESAAERARLLQPIRESGPGIAGSMTAYALPWLAAGPTLGAMTVPARLGAVALGGASEGILTQPVMPGQPFRQTKLQQARASA